MLIPITMDNNCLTVLGNLFVQTESMSCNPKINTILHICNQTLNIYYCYHNTVILRDSDITNISMQYIHIDKGGDGRCR